nr:MAG TPA: hypothetical protein [Caudoviricetes sp.]
MNLERGYLSIGVLLRTWLIYKLIRISTTLII